jgi:hypothetical protein
MKGDTMTANLRALLAAATAGKWTYFIDDYGDEDVGRPGTMFITVDLGHDEDMDLDRLYIQHLTQHDAALIVHLRNTAEAREAVVEAARLFHEVEVEWHDNQPSFKWAGVPVVSIRAIRDALAALDALEAKS